MFKFLGGWIIRWLVFLLFSLGIGDDGKVTGILIAAGVHHKSYAKRYKNKYLLLSGTTEAVRVQECVMNTR